MNKETKRQSISPSRKSRTRTLIQLGALIEIAELTNFFQIELGDDLQCDLAKQKKSAVLLGALIQLQQMLAVSNIDGQIEKWQKAGMKMLEKRQYVN